MVSVSIARDHGRLSWGGPVSLSASRPDVVLLRLCLITFRDLFLRVEPGPRRGTPHVSFRMVGPTIPAPGKGELAWLSSCEREPRRVTGRAQTRTALVSSGSAGNTPGPGKQQRRAGPGQSPRAESWFGGAPLLPLPLTFQGRG
jgi:hypothetical protein